MFAGLGAVVASPFSGWLSDHAGKRTVIVLANVVLAALFIVVARTNWGIRLVAGVAVLSIAASARQAPLHALSTEIVGTEIRGEYVALRNAASQTGIAAVAAISSFVFDSAGFGGVSIVAAFVTLLIPICCIWLKEPSLSLVIATCSSNGNVCSATVRNADLSTVRVLNRKYLNIFEVKTRLVGQTSALRTLPNIHFRLDGSGVHPDRGFCYPCSMPANLTPQYMEAERRFKEAGSVQEKIAALEEMMATIPKHKGTEKLQAELKKKMSALRKESETQKKSGGRRDFFVIDREGARQLAIVGSPNAGKSQLLRDLTNATPEVAEYPYTTRTPIPGMMVFENVRLQLLDLPPISPEYTESWVAQVIRNADAVLWIVDVSDDDILERLEETQKWLAEGKVDLGKMKILMVGNKTDAAGAAERATIVREMYQDQFPFVLRSGDAEAFKKVVYDFLDVVRVYTKAPGKKPDFSDPYVVPRGSTVLDVAEKVHRDFVENLKYARIWGDGKPDGIMVPRDFVINEGDVLELHTA